MSQLSSKVVLFAALLIFSLVSVADDAIGSYVDRLINSFFAITKDATLNEHDKITKASAVLEDNMDFKWMGSFVLGRYRRTMSPAEIDNFVAIYKGYLICTYAGAVKEYKGEKIDVKGVRPLEENEYVVKTAVSAGPNKEPMSIDYMVRQYPNDKATVYKVFDIVTEGVSLISSQQSEFGSVIGSSGIAALEDHLKEKTRQ